MESHRQICLTWLNKTNTIVVRERERLYNSVETFYPRVCISTCYKLCILIKWFHIIYVCVVDIFLAPDTGPDHVNLTCCILHKVNE